MARPQRIEEVVGQSVSGDTVTRKYLFIGWATDEDVLIHIQLFPDPTPELPTVVPYNLKSLTIQMPPAIEELGANCWSVTVQYGPRSAEAISPTGGAAATQTAVPHGDSGNTEPIGPEISWGIIGGSQTITQSLKTLQKKLRPLPDSVLPPATTGTPRLTSPRNWAKAIGVDPRTGDVKGCERLTGAVEQTIELTIPGRAVTSAWIRLVEELSTPTPSVNSHPFLGYRPGEVLFLGIPNLRSIQVGAAWKGTFKIAISRNRKKVTINETPGEELELDEVRGWSHIWVTYIELKRVTSNGYQYRSTEPLEAYEEQIYPERDLRLLGLEKRKLKVIA
jgi:hypothetical protein